MLSTEQLLNEGHYGPVNPASVQDTPMDKTKPAEDLTKFVGPGSERPDLADVLAWTDQLLDAVNALHTKSQPIIHAGISPSTVTVDGSGTIHLKTIREASDTQVNYKPLEQLWDSLDHFSQRAILNRYDDEAQRWLSQPPTAASDIYAVGATVYAVLTGTPPPDALDRSIAAMEDKKDPLVEPRLLAPSIPPEISDVIMKAMAVARDDRYYSAVILRQVFKTAAVRVRERLEAELSDDAARPAAEVPIEAPALLPLVEAAPTIADEPLAIEALESVNIDSLFVEESLLEDVLEVPTVPVDQNLTISEAPNKVEATAAPVIAEPVTAAPEVIQEPTPEPIAEPQKAAPAAIFSSVTEEESDAPARSKMPAIAAAAVVLVLAIGGGIYKFSSASSAVPASETTSKPAAVLDPPQSENKPTEAAPVVADQPTETSTDAAAVQEPGHIEGSRLKQTRASAAPQAEPAKKAPAPAKTQAPKKQVTVDDLINDH